MDVSDVILYGDSAARTIDAANGEVDDSKEP